MLLLSDDYEQHSNKFRQIYSELKTDMAAKITGIKLVSKSIMRIIVIREETPPEDQEATPPGKDVRYSNLQNLLMSPTHKQSMGRSPVTFTRDFLPSSTAELNVPKVTYHFEDFTYYLSSDADGRFSILRHTLISTELSLMGFYQKYFEVVLSNKLHKKGYFALINPSDSHQAVFFLKFLSAEPLNSAPKFNQRVLSLIKLSLMGGQPQPAGMAFCWCPTRSCRSGSPTWPTPRKSSTS
jgi:hypothetical protein